MELGNGVDVAAAVSDRNSTADTRRVSPIPTAGSARPGADWNSMNYPNTSDVGTQQPAIGASRDGFDLATDVHDTAYDSEPKKHYRGYIVLS